MFHLVRGSVYLLVVLGTSFRFLYTGLMTIFTYIVFIVTYIYIYIYIYDDVCCSSPISLCVVSFLSLCTCYLLYASLYFYFTLRCLDEFCLKCFRKTGCQSLSSHKLSSCKVFQEFVLGLYFIILNK